MVFVWRPGGVSWLARLGMVVGLVATGCGPQLPGQGGGTGAQTSSSSTAVGGTVSTSGRVTSTASTVSSAGGCAQWGESCDARPCCDAEHSCDAATLLCTTPDDNGGVGFDGGWTDGGGGVSFECDLFLQDCRKGEKCMPWANDGGPVWNATRCAPLDPDAQPVGSECIAEGSGVVGIDNCDLGLMCWNVDASGVGVCEDVCLGTPRAPICEDRDDTCLQTYGGALVLCLPECDPLLQSCGPGQGCYPANDLFACWPSRFGEGVHGDPCEFANACDSGTLCIGVGAHSDCMGAIGCCSTICSLADPSADAACAALDAAQTCEAWFVEGMAPVGYEDVGVCAIAV